MFWTVAKFGNARWNFAVTKNSQTASVEQAFKKFSTTATPAAPTVLRAKIGSLDNTVNTTFTDAGVAVTLADIIAAGTKVKVTGDFSAKGKVYLDANLGDNCATESIVGTFASGQHDVGFDYHGCSVGSAQRLLRGDRRYSCA